MILSPAQIAQYAAAAGFTGNDLATAVAIALAESNPPGNPQSYNPETAAGAAPGQGSYGLWQIYLGKHPEFSGEDLYDPQVNANAAYTTYAIANGFHPWSTYTSGKYQQYVPAVLAALQPAAAPAPTAPLVLDASTGLPVTDYLPSTPAPMAAIDPTQLAPAELSFGTVLLWGALGVFALWLFEEAT